MTSSGNSPTDGCEWALTCDGSIELTVECDGENDGTNTSLCGCMVDGEFVKDAGLVQGEGVDACLAADINCVDPSCTQGVDPPPCTEDFTEPTGCSLPGSVVVIATDRSPTQGCEGSYTCDGGELAVSCDAENDGTGTSLCDCHINGEVKYAGVTEGEGETACNNAFAFCIDPTACAD